MATSSTQREQAETPFAERVKRRGERFRRFDVPVKFEDGSVEYLIADTICVLPGRRKNERFALRLCRGCSVRLSDERSGVALTWEQEARLLRKELDAALALQTTRTPLLVIHPPETRS